jgi:hypothetical protein
MICSSERENWCFDRLPIATKDDREVTRDQDILAMSIESISKIMPVATNDVSFFEPLGQLEPKVHFVGSADPLRQKLPAGHCNCTDLPSIVGQ